MAAAQHCHSVTGVGAHAGFASPVGLYRPAPRDTSPHQELCGSVKLHVSLHALYPRPRPPAANGGLATAAAWLLSPVAVV